MPKLRMLRGPEPDRVYELKGEIILVGRSLHNDITIQADEVSRNHCRLEWILNDYKIYDAESMNGTYVDGFKVNAKGRVLYNHCIIEIGDSIAFQYTVDSVPKDTGALTRDRKVHIDHNTKPFLGVKSLSQVEVQVYLLDEIIIKLGRDLTNNIVILEEEVSQNHIRFIRTSQGYIIEDHLSTNGTAVNGKFIKEPTLLRSDDIITIGATVEMVFVTEQSKDYSHYRDIYLESEMTDTLAVRPFEIDSISQEAEDHIFLAYAREDWDPIVNRLLIYLEDNDVSVWVDQNLSPDSDVWIDAIEQAINECTMMVVVLSNQSVKSSYIKRGLRRFMNRKKPIILLEYKQVERLPMIIQNLERIDYSANKPEEAFLQVLNKIQRIVL